jgi:hypothetical protein
MDLAGQMLKRRRVELSWVELESWSLAPETLRLMRRLIQHGELLRGSGPSARFRLVFRHDRVRDWLLAEAACSMDELGELTDDIVGEAFFAEILGLVLVRRRAQATLLERALRLNPLALFHALRVCPEGAVEERGRIVEAIERWLESPANLGPAVRYLRWEALATLEATDGPEVPGLVIRFPDPARFGGLARLRNGDIGGGIGFCLTSELGVGDLRRDRHIEHAKLRFGETLIRQADELLRRQDLDRTYRIGLLRLAGHFGDPSLGPAIAVSWDADASRGERLADYLWAFARCSEPVTAAQHLDPVCAAWAALSDLAEGEHTSSPRDALAAENVRWAFERAIPRGALGYFIKRAQQPDLHGQITYMLQGIDDPRVLKFIVAELGAMRTRAAADGGFVPFSLFITDHWRRAQDAGHPMSTDSRGLLLGIWRDRQADMQQRFAAFDIWAATRGADDIELLRSAAADIDLADRILRHRLDRADRAAVPALTEKIRDRKHGYRWWGHARHVWCAELTQALDEVLSWRRDNVAQSWSESIEEDWRTQEMLMRLPIEEAERLLLKHWGHLKFSPHFVQAALYVATEALCRLAAASVAEAPDPGSLFRYLSQHWGVRTSGHPGITRKSQVLALEPYLGLIRDSDLHWIADACNRLGWFDLRKRLLDPRIASCVWSVERAPAQFDSLTAKGLYHWIHLEVEEALKTGASWDEYFAAMRVWLAERRTFEALQLLAGAVAHKGSRRDLSALRIYEGMPAEAAEALIADVAFAVHRRTPD